MHQHFSSTSEKTDFPFVMIPEVVLANDQLSSTTKLIFGIVLSLSRKYGYAFAHNPKIAAKLGVSESTVSNSINQLAGLDLFFISNAKSSFRRIKINHHLLKNSVLPLKTSELPSEIIQNELVENSEHKREQLKEKEKKSLKENNGFAVYFFKLNSPESKELQSLFSEANKEDLKDILANVIYRFNRRDKLSFSSFSHFILKELRRMPTEDIANFLINEGAERLVFRALDADGFNMQDHLIKESGDEFDPASKAFDAFVDSYRSIIIDHVPQLLD